jgi:hypothetical protein
MTSQELRRSHHRWLPAIDGHGDATAELIESGAAEFAAGLTFAADVDELTLLPAGRGTGRAAAGARDPRRLLPPGRRGLERRPHALDRLSPAGHPRRIALDPGHEVAPRPARLA